MGVIDAHVHVFPDRLLDAIWKWFDEFAWPVHERLYSEALIDRLQTAGSDYALALVYAHRTGMSKDLNRWVGDLARRHPMLVPGATVHPHDPDVREILLQAKEVHGARVVKQHCHVLRIASDDPVMFPLYEACIELDLPLVLHCGNGPKADTYPNMEDVSGARHTLPVLERYPELKLIVPHLGAMEEDVFLGWLDRFPNLYLDTAVALKGFLPNMPRRDRKVLADYPGRILFGTDFPQIPFAVETERQEIEALGFPTAARREILHDAAARLFNLPRAGTQGGRASCKPGLREDLIAASDQEEPDEQRADQAHAVPARVGRRPPRRSDDAGQGARGLI